MKNLLNIFTILFLLSCANKKSEYHLEFEEYDFEFDTYNWDSNPYKFSSYIRDSVISSKGNQYAAWNFSYIGDIESMHKSWDSDAKERKGLTATQRDSFATFEARNAIEHILEKSKDHQVVIINEAHQMPQHRVFTTSLLEGLKDQGFKHLGLEAYFNSPLTDSLLQATGYPILKSGFYTKEPQFGNLIREARKKEFNVFGYESQEHEDSKGREINQAKNIQAYLEKYPTEKILIHCGFDHGCEGELNNKWEKAMAGRLTEFTNIDPLTINQVIYSEKSGKEYENPYYQTTDLDKSSVFIDQKGNVFGEYREGTWYDIAVFHPRSKNYNRPQWMIYDNRRSVEITFEEEKIECPCMILAYKSGETIGSAVPYDIQETSDKKATIILDESGFEVVILNEKGEAIKSVIEKQQ